MSTLRSISIFSCLLKLCLIFGISGDDSNSNQKCLDGGIVTPGWTVPKGDIELEVGTPLEIYCVLDPNNTNFQGYTSKDIIFKRGNRKIDSKYVTLVNSTTARLYMDNLPVSVEAEYVYCHLILHGDNNSDNTSTSSLEIPQTSERMICLNSVSIGCKPQEVTDLRCVSKNWEILSCDWTEPHNGVKTNYSIFYTLPKRASRQQLFNCPDPEPGHCTWTSTTTPTYRKTFEYFYFVINATNKFGITNQTIKFHHYAHVVPYPPKNLMAVSKTPHSIYLQFDIGELGIFEKGLTYRIKHTWNTSDHWNVIEYHAKDVRKTKDIIGINVTALKYPNVPYDFRVYMKSAIASESGWSEPASVVVKTSPCPPYRAPETDIGSFEIHGKNSNDRDVLVYWKQIPEEEHNGDNFQYDVTVFEDNVEVNVKPTSVTKTYAHFTNLSFNSYRFVVRSRNDQGTSPNGSVVYLPRKHDVLSEPILFTKVDFGGGVYELSWKLPNATDERVVNYTVFWCESYRDYPYPCSSSLDWIHLPAGTLKHNFTAKPSIGYQFAISVNSVSSSSGMFWALCTVLHNQVNKIRNVWIGKVGSHYIDLRWKLDCAERAEGIKGYNITYCPVSFNTVDRRYDCSEPEKTYLIYGDVTTNHGNISGLRPYTTYRVSVAIFTDKLLGPASDWMYNRTHDGPPDINEMHVEVLNITDTTAVIKWNTPTNINGLLDHYEVYYDTDKKIIVKDNIVLLTGLRSYEQYHIRVVACTAVCSRTDPLALHTKIGTPGEVRKLEAEKLPTGDIKLKWEPPAIPAGPNVMYDVKIQYDRSEANSNSTFSEFETNETNKIVKIPCNQEPSNNSVFKFLVRARNTDDSDMGNIKRYVGPWSSAYTIDCMNGARLPTMWKVMLIFVVCVLCSAIFAFFGKKGFYKCQQMKKVEVVLPAKFTIPQLFPNEMKDTSYHVDLKSWTDPNEIDHLNKLSDADQSSIDCIDLDLDTDRETSRSSSGCYTS